MNLIEQLKRFDDAKEDKEKKQILEEIYKDFNKSNIYTLFGVEKYKLKNYGTKDLDNAFRTISMKIHPDRILPTKEYYIAAVQLFQVVSAANDQITEELDSSNKSKRSRANNNNRYPGNNSHRSNNNRNYDNPYFMPYPNNVNFNYYSFGPPPHFSRGTTTPNIPPHFSRSTFTTNSTSGPSFFSGQPASQNLDQKITIDRDIESQESFVHDTDGTLIIKGSIAGQLVCNHNGKVLIIGDVTGTIVNQKANITLYGKCTGKINSIYGCITSINSFGGEISNVYGDIIINCDLLASGKISTVFGKNNIKGKTLGQVTINNGQSFYTASTSSNPYEAQYQNNYRM